MKFTVKIESWLKFEFETAEEALQFALMAKKAYVGDDHMKDVTVIVDIGIGEVSA